MQHTILFGLVFAFVAPSPFQTLEAQTAPPDSALVRMVSPALVRLLDREITAAALGRHHVLKLVLPSSAAWSPVAAHLLSATKGRVPAAHDSIYTALTVREIKFAGDTVIATLVKESLDRCPKDRWVTTGTDYELRILRFRSYWTEISFAPGLTWDAFGCPDA